MVIRRFVEEDADETAQVIAKTLRISNSPDYPAENIEANISSHSPDVLKERAKDANMYVVCDNENVVGCGSITGYWGSKTESILLTIFVLPEYQNKGVGRKIIETLESDEFFLRAKRVEIPASITACEFYKKMGYTYKNNIATPGEDGCIRLEKHR
ncbi:GNAT family N-acetyltransferase [[Clostridium] fimetarium]|uniref:Ribosomal protein S18 acetylase RimI n=1 Tax=[Clostridium] fimetarium TaxID=99656 RepID=A0A1I0QW52_9FIRM|nr:GNAT family N-acetyltransferase [[Clostridium] fimetarium]SEW31940.1 Ribosomal protein S18 acetylase RimI [[Clostridium] fimetarium]